MQGTYNQGGSGAMVFCVEGITVILTKRAPELIKNSHETDDNWSITITRVNSAKENKMREPFYTYLAPNEKTKDNEGLGVLTFKADELELWPDRMIPYKKSFKSGALIKLMEYDLK